MPSRLVFEDTNNNELTCFINKDGNLFITVGPSDDEQGGGYITLDRSDVKELIQVLTKLETEMDE